MNESTLRHLRRRNFIFTVLCFLFCIYLRSIYPQIEASQGYYDFYITSNGLLQLGCIVIIVNAAVHFVYLILTLPLRERILRAKLIAAYILLGILSIIFLAFVAVCVAEIVENSLSSCTDPSCGGNVSVV